ncbi:neurofilament medium polypeptide [Prunus yedoensis var. nudiflora]|uniref:Neurofilament medium polypeptide n=1 Tax=Prunus yedoensis var. nudiflora TaxID=2094558 RepID=A0A314UZ79_PRUYE|nr:neurofilament medium polypeptide [Prunus yedoensis var. nudiflora]
MLKQSPSRNQRSKGFKVKHALQMFLLLAICIWLLYQLKHSHDKKAYEESSAKISGKMQNGHETIKLGRRSLHPRVEETSLDIGRDREKEEESEEEVDESKDEESEEEGRGAEDDEIDGHDQERSEEESEGVEDLIDEEDTEREEENEEKGNDLEIPRLLEDQAQNEDTRNTQEAREEQYKGDDASSAVKQNTQKLSSEIEVGSLRKVKEEEVDKENKTNGILDVRVDTNDSGPKFGNIGTAKNAAVDNAVYGEERGYTNSSINTIEQAKMSNDSTVALVEFADSLDGTEMLAKLYKDASLTSSQRHSYLEAVSGKENENPKSKDMQSESVVVSEAIADLEKSSAPKTTNENDQEVANVKSHAYGGEQSSGKFNAIDNQ